jgi:hypothetical protein
MGGEASPGHADQHLPPSLGLTAFAISLRETSSTSARLIWPLPGQPPARATPPSSAAVFRAKRSDGTPGRRARRGALAQDRPRLGRLASTVSPNDIIAEIGASSSSLGAPAPPPATARPASFPVRSSSTSSKSQSLPSQIVDNIKTCLRTRQTKRGRERP